MLTQLERALYLFAKSLTAMFNSLVTTSNHLDWVVFFASFHWLQAGPSVIVLNGRIRLEQMNRKLTSRANHLFIFFHVYTDGNDQCNFIEVHHFKKKRFWIYLWFQDETLWSQGLVVKETVKKLIEHSSDHGFCHQRLALMLHYPVFPEIVMTKDPPVYSLGF